MRTLLSVFDQIAIKKLDHPILFASILLAAAVLGLIQFLPAGWQVPAMVFLVVVYVSAASLNTYRLVHQRLNDHQRQTQALIALHQLLPFRAPIPTLSGWSASPELLVHLLNQIRQRRPSTVVELGSGASTIATPYMLDQIGGGALYSIDHEESYAAQTRGQLALHGHHSVTLRVAPLTDHVLDGSTYRWYDLAGLDLPNSIDLLLVDGPPEQTNALARYPALPLLWNRLSDGALILMDDADRDDEQEIIRRWIRDFPVELDAYRSSLKGFAVLRVRKTGTGA